LGILKYLADPNSQLQEIVFWLLGGLYSVTWKSLLYILPVVLLGLVVIYLMRWRLNVLSDGADEEGQINWVVNVQRDRLIILIATTLMVSAFISVAGVIGWVGLVIPHTIRMFIGTPDNRLIVPMSACLARSFYF